MTTHPTRRRRWFAELKRRRVIRVSLVYAVTAIAAVEAADIIFPRLALPDWTVTFVLGLAIVGFPVAIALAWVFDITPAGVERTPSSNMPAPPDSTEAPPAHSPPADVAQPRADGRAQPLSIAVLPFVNMSADPDNEYFSDGLSEEMLNLLAQVPALRVAARTSSFAFKGKDTSIIDIAGRLRVANVLEGSAQIRRSRTHHGPADRCRGRVPPVESDVRPRAARYLRGSGRDRPGHRGVAACPTGH